jgi:hypothetical protein
MSNHTASGEVHDALSGADWSTRMVTEATLHPLIVRLYVDSPYVAELYRDDLQRRIVHPANAAPRNFAHPLLIPRRQRRYYLPGSADDILLHTSCVVACCHALVRYLPADSDAFDFGPPLIRELSEGSFGRHQTMMSYWARLDLAMQRHFDAGFSHVLFTDVARCIESIDPERMLVLLREADADDDAIRLLEKMHRFWQRAGCRGLPLTAGFRVLIKLYLKSVDDRLRSEGITFLRLQDDFRLFCHGENEARHALSILSDALAACGFTLNERKTCIFSRSELRWSWKKRRLDWTRTLSQGVGLPALSDALRFRALRPSALRLLRLFYGRRWKPV